MRRLLSFVAVGFAVHSALGGISGCSSADPVKNTAPSGKKGTLSLALETVSASGKVYRLRFATFFVNPSFFFPPPTPFPIKGIAGVSGASDVAFPDGGVVGGGTVVGGGSAGVASVPFDGGFGGSTGQGGAPGGFIGGGVFGGSTSVGGIPGGFFGSTGSPGSGSFTLSSEDNPDSPVIEQFLAAGSYEIDLFPGWFIEQVDTALGTSTEVPATLQSSESQFFNITSDQDSFVRFDFLVDGSQVSFGAPGKLTVGIGIQETNGSSFCGDGVMQPGEDCDGGDLGGQTCASVTMGAFPQGPLFCTKDCRFDTSFCQGGFFDGGTGGFGTGGFVGTGGFGTADGGVGLPPVDAGMGPAAGGAGGKGPIP
jgi:hypothetical protein